MPGSEQQPISNNVQATTSQQQQNGPLCKNSISTTTNPSSPSSSCANATAVPHPTTAVITTNGVTVPTSFNSAASVTVSSKCNSCSGSPPGSIAVARSPTGEPGGNGDALAQAAAVHLQQQQQHHHPTGDVVTSVTPAVVTATTTTTTTAGPAPATSNGGSANSKASPRESGEDSEDESEILEESPCGRWLKRREEVEQRDVPGIDCAHLAMDTEEGVEVVWNEVQFSERRNFKAQEEKIQQVFENLTQLEHPNIVKFHRYWTDTHNDKPRVIFITEYMSSGSLKQFLKRTKRNVKRLPLQAWRRWCTQILSALSYLHSCTPPIIHGNLTCDTIFIQHNGLVKIGSVAPDAIHHHVKTCRENMKNMHFIAPEYGSAVTPAIDIYSFGMCALEMAALEIQGNGDSGTLVTDEQIAATIDSLDHAQQKDFILKCLNKNPSERHSARELLFHSLLFEVHSLKLLAAHCLVDNTPNFSETLIDEMMQRCYKPDAVVAEITRSADAVEMRLTDVPTAEKLEKFVEDVRYGIYPLTAFAARQPPPQRPRAVSPETIESVKSVSPEPLEIETRKVVFIMCEIKPREDSCDLMMQIILRMDDKMNRQLTCQICEEDTPSSLSEELVRLGFISDVDREKIAAYIEDKLRLHFSKRQQHLLTMGSGNGASGGLIQGVIESAVGTDLHHHHHHHLPMSVHTTSIERNWTVADSESPSSGASILESGASILSGGGGRRPGTGGSSSGGITSDGPSTPATDGISTTVLASPVGSSTPGFTPVAQHMINPMEVLMEGNQQQNSTAAKPVGAIGEKGALRTESVEVVDQQEKRKGSDATPGLTTDPKVGGGVGDGASLQHQQSK